MPSHHRLSRLLLLAVFLPGVVLADEPIDFAAHVQPIFRRHCVRCHGPDKREGGLRLDSHRALRGGDNYSPAVQPGHSSESPLFQFVSRDDADLRMPPEGPRLSTEEIDLLGRWIDQGAPWPEDSAPVADRWARHWAFQPLARPQLPAESPAASNAVDQFVLARLNEHGLSLSPPADRRTLIRRLYFDLLGLPPAPQDIQDFQHDRHPLAYENLVERLLASPRYGERWARHWLDVVRFAESHGFEMNQPRPNAWRYRDYVIAALNDDQPYDQFVREQIAGDAYGNDVATAFLVGGPWDQVKSPDPVLTAQQRADELHDMISTTGSTFMGLTIGCARCHSHKFDPISQAEYYAWKACFEGVQHGERPLPGAETAELAKRQAVAEGLRAKLADLESEPAPAPVNARVNVERFAAVRAERVRFTIRATNSSQPCLDELEVWTAGPDSRNVAAASAGAKATASSVYPDSKIHRLEHVNDGRYGNSFSWISNESGAGWVEIQFGQAETVDRILWGRDRQQKYTDRLATDYIIEVFDGTAWRQVASAADHVESAERKQRREQLEQQIAAAHALPSVYAGTFMHPGPTHRLHRGDATQPREPIPPSSLALFKYNFTLPADAPERDRRAALADWITDARNPLTARVMVNRLWQHHFGQGLAPNPSDFGLNGGQPSHPQLLDWLAAEFRDSGWSIKRMHRLICTSATYRQSSQARSDALTVDAANRLLWRFPILRLEAEPLRDAILWVSGQLRLTMTGPGFDLFEPNTNYVKVYTPKHEWTAADYRRMIYWSKPRMQLEDTFGAFDCPDAGQVAPLRTSSTTPLQALNLLNSPFVLEQAEYFRQRLEREAGDQPMDQIVHAFRLCFAREPSPEELESAGELARQHGLNALCRALLNANEFIYVE